MIQNMDYKQKHPETCLAKSILIVINKQKNAKIAKNMELKIFNFALKYNRENFTIGHLQKVINEFNVKISWYVDTKIYYEFVKKQKLSAKINLILKKVNLKTIDQLIEKQPIIIYVDQFYLWKQSQGLYYKYHYPHFIIVLHKNKSKYRIIDPNTGKKEYIGSKKLSKAIISLRNHLWFSPQIIQFTG